MDTPRLQVRLLAVLAADVSGYSRLMSQDDATTVVALDSARAVFRQQIAAHGGRVIDMAGDSVLAVFEAGTLAVSAALAVQQQLFDSAADLPEERRLRFRIGIHVGDVIVKRDGSVYGNGVNIAARLQGLAMPGMVAVSQAVRDIVSGRVSAVFNDMGDHLVKNIAEPVHAFSARSPLPGEKSAENEFATGVQVARQGNLSEMLPGLFGRDDDIEALLALIQNHRIVTMVGTGGIGKTCLAQAVSHAARSAFKDGAWLVEFASVADSALVPAAVAQALGTHLSGVKSAQDEVIDALRNRSLLLVLDNCEHLISAVSSLVIALIESAPKLRTLVTSQELLRVPQERLYRVGALTVPTDRSLLAARGSSAVALLVGRVRAMQPEFALTEGNAADLVDICQRLDGLPLALELAAARVPLLGVVGIRERLRERFRMLTGGARTAPQRHQTLRATLDWSYGLLTSDEARVFRRASVFVGSFTMATAQQALVDEHLDEWAVLECLGALVDKSLVALTYSDPPRYRLLESARAFALEELRDSGEIDTTLEGHARAMAKSFEFGLSQSWTATRTARLERHLPDLDNLRAALDWAAEHDDRLHVELAANSTWIWSGAGQRVEGLRRGEAALSRVGPTTAPAVEARLQSGWAVLALRNPGPASRAAAERSVALFRALNDRIGLYLALGRLALIATLARDIAIGEVATTEMAHLIDPSWPVAARWEWVTARAYVVFSAGAFVEGQSVVEEMMRLATASGEAYKMRTAMLWLEQSAQFRGEYGEAVTRGRELVALTRLDPFDSAGLANTVANLSLALIHLGELEEGLSAAREAAQLTSQMGSLWLMLDPLALLACKRGRLTEAALVLGRAETVNRWRGGLREQVEQLARDETMLRLKKALPQDELERLLMQGAAMSDEQAAGVALEG